MAGGQTEDLYFSGMNSLLDKCRKCTGLNGDYIEKLSVVCNISIILYGRVAKLFERPSYLLFKDVLPSALFSDMVGSYTV